MIIPRMQDPDNPLTDEEALALLGNAADHLERAERYLEAGHNSKSGVARDIALMATAHSTHAQALVLYMLIGIGRD
jgi:hypothetical protein